LYQYGWRGFIVNFSHAGKSTSKIAWAHIVEKLCHILGVEDKPQKKSTPVGGETDLRHSLHIKMLKETA
jgi:hypothetical protein